MRKKNRDDISSHCNLFIVPLNAMDTPAPISIKKGAVPEIIEPLKIALSKVHVHLDVGSPREFLSGPIGKNIKA